MKDGIKYIRKEIVYSILGILIFFAISRINFKVIREYSYIFYALSVLLLIIVLAVGVAKHSSKRWIDLFGLATIQPSEFAKIGLIFSLSFVYSSEANNFKKFIYYTLLAIPIAGLIFFQPDMGSALVIAFIYFIFVSFTLHIKYAALLFLSGLSIIPLLPRLLLPYQMERILIFFDPYRDPLGSGYNVLQSIIAIGSGGLFGKGFSQSTMTKLRFVPVQYADFIFSAIGEIFGFMGCFIVIALLAYILYSCIKAYSSTENLFSKGLMLGVFAMFFFQTMVNIGMSIGLMPVTGIPLPFVSYGGSSTIANYLALGLIASVITYKEEITILPL